MPLPNIPTAAALIYKKSYVYPSATSFVWYPMSPRTVSLFFYSCLRNHLYASFSSSENQKSTRALAESSSTELNEEQDSIEQAQNQFVIPDGPLNVSFPPMGNFYFLPSKTRAARVNYGEGFENFPNMPNSKMGAQRKLQID
ncbi:hypothetical protein CR513_18928, partial [Mucuna pruriens]